MNRRLVDGDIWLVWSITPPGRNCPAREVLPAGRLPAEQSQLHPLPWIRVLPMVFH